MSSYARLRARATDAKFGAEATGQLIANYDAQLLACACARHLFVGIPCLPVERRDHRIRCLHCGTWYDERLATELADARAQLEALIAVYELACDELAELRARIESK